MFDPAVHLVADAAQRLGVNSAFRALQNRSLLILNYHAVVPDECTRDPMAYGNAVGVSEFSWQMAELVRYFHPIAPAELRAWLDGSARAPRNPVLVTFDDGYRNNLTYAVPVLRRLGIPALIGLCTGYIGQKRVLWPDEIFLRVLSWPEPRIPTPWSALEQPVPAEPATRLLLANRLREGCKRISWKRLPDFLCKLRRHPMPKSKEELHAFLTWEEVRKLQILGFEVASHTVEHPILTQVPHEGLERELKDSKRLIEEQTGSKCACFVYPNGGPADFSPDIADEVRRAGYEFAFTVCGGLASPSEDPLMLDRVYIPGGTSPAEFHCRISGFQGRMKRWLQWREIRGSSPEASDRENRRNGND